MNWRAIAWFTFLAVAMPGRAWTQGTKARESMSVSFPGKNWAVEIDSPGFTVESEVKKSDGREYFLAHNSTTDVVLSVTLEQSKGGADSSTCPGYLEKRVQALSQLGVTNVKESTIGSMAVIEYLIPKPNGIPLRQKNVVACIAKEDIYIDIHLSKANFQPSDESLFTNVLNQVHITNRTGPEASISPGAPGGKAVSSGASSLNYFREGNRYYKANDFGNSIAPHQKALELEKQQPRLSKNYWRVLVDNLGMAYGVTGDLNHAEETFNYGVSKDPDYPMFHYNLGCVYAERDGMEAAMKHLQKAFALKANAIPDEGMPDPRQDDSFRRFMSNERFRKFVDSLIGSN